MTDLSRFVLVPREATEWQPIETAPKDGTMLFLLIGPDDRDHPLEDTAEGSRTVGFNNLDNDGEDVWQFAGWCWSHDHFNQGKGTPSHWMPLPPLSARPSSCDALLQAMGEVIEAFEHADRLDWDHLMLNELSDGGHGRFWKAVMMRVRDALSRYDTAKGKM